MLRKHLNEMLHEDTFLIPGADECICGLTPQGQPIYDYNLLVEHYMDEFGSDYLNQDELHVACIEWVEDNICFNSEAPLIMYRIIEE